MMESHAATIPCTWPPVYSTLDRLERPSRWQERLGQRLLLFLSPRLARSPSADPPGGLHPFERFEVRRSHGRGSLSALWYPAAGAARGAVLLAHPWMRQGQSYFFQRGRLRALRRAGYHSLTFDLGGVGRSGPPPPGFYDGDLADAAGALAERAGGLPLHLWGVSAGGYWAHLLLGRSREFRGAVFEDVASHLIEWSKRTEPRGLPFYLFFQHCLPRAYRFLDARRHASCLRLGAAAYLSGDRDRSVLPQETRELARRARGRSHLVEGADHLQSIRLAHGEALRWALETFETAAGSAAPVAR